MVFVKNQQARITGKLTDGSNFSYTGVTTDATLTPNNAGVQLNKILAIGGKTFVVDGNMKRIITEEANQSNG